MTDTVPDDCEHDWQRADESWREGRGITRDRCERCGKVRLQAHGPAFDYDPDGLYGWNGGVAP